MQAIEGHRELKYFHDNNFLLNGENARIIFYDQTEVNNWPKKVFQAFFTQIMFQWLFKIED